MPLKQTNSSHSADGPAWQLGQPIPVHKQTDTLWRIIIEKSDFLSLSRHSFFDTNSQGSKSSFFVDKYSFERRNVREYFVLNNALFWVATLCARKNTIHRFGTLKGNTTVLTCWKRPIFLATDDGMSCSHWELRWNGIHKSELSSWRVLYKFVKVF